MLAQALSRYLGNLTNGLRGATWVRNCANGATSTTSSSSSIIVYGSSIIVLFRRSTPVEREFRVFSHGDFIVPDVCPVLDLMGTGVSKKGVSGAAGSSSDCVAVILGGIT